MKKVVTFFFLIFCLSCSQNNKDVVFKLEGKEIKNEIPNLRFPFRIGVANSSLVVLDLASSEYNYYVCDFPNLNFLYPLGQKGSGPEEITLCTPFQIKKDNLFFLDGALGKLHHYSLANKQEPQLINIQSFNIPVIIDFVLIDDTTILAGDMTGNNRLLKINPTETKHLYSIPTNNQQSSSPGHIWRSYMDYNPELRKLAMATQNGEVIEIYSPENEQIEPIICIGEKGMPREKNQIEGFHDIKWHNNTIYALFSGRSRDELNRKFDAGQREPDGGNQIKVYDENGNYQKTYLLNEYINGFWVDSNSKNSRILGITSNLDNPLIEFPIPDLL